MAAIQARDNAELGGSGGAWQTLRRQAYAAQKGVCAGCGLPMVGRYEVDHVIPRSEFRAGRAIGDPNAAGNLQALHRECHAARTAARRTRC